MANKHNDEDLIETGGEALQAVLDDLQAETLSESDYIGGVPLGGIGTGKIEIAVDGSFQNITINNNIDVPVSMNADLLKGSLFFSKCKQITKILKKGEADIQVKTLNYRGLYPEVFMNFDSDEIGYELSIEGFSPIIPYNQEDSSIPAAIFLFNIKNNGDEKLPVTFGLSYENTIGIGGWPFHHMPDDATHPEPLIKLPNTPFYGYVQSDRTKTAQKPVEMDEAVGIKFYSERFNPDYPLCYGEYAILTSKMDGVTANSFSWDASKGEKDFVRVFESGQYNHDIKGIEGKVHPAGVLLVETELSPGESRVIPMVFAWYMPNLNPWGAKYPGSPAYTNQFENVLEAASYCLKEWKRLLKETTELHDVMMESSLPDWLKEKIINDMFPLTTCSYYTADGKFSINESPTRMGGCLGTMDQRLSSQSIYTLFWPELDKAELWLFANLQGTKISPDENLGEQEGYMPHDLGSGWFRKGGVLSRWPDLASAFTIQSYRYGLWSGDTEFLKEIYPHVKAALQWESRFSNGDLPSLGNAKETSRGKIVSGTSFDCYRWYGINSYTGSLWLAAIKVGLAMAEKFGDTEFIEECSGWFDKSLDTMVNKLWLGTYFRNYFDPGNPENYNDDCCHSQLAGEWCLDLMDMSNSVPEDMISSSLDYIIKWNDKLSPEGVGDLVSPEGKFRAVVGDGVNFGDVPLGFIQYAETYYACLAIYNGHVEEGLNFIKKINDNIIYRHKRPWDVNITIDPISGKLLGLPWYMTNTASWYLINAIAGFTVDMTDGKIVISPNLTYDGSLRIPLFMPGFWVILDYSESVKSIRFHLNCVKGSSKFAKFVTDLKPGLTAGEILLNGRNVVFNQNGCRVEVDSNLELSKDGENIVFEICFA